jgi:hypothetical protein
MQLPDYNTTSDLREPYLLWNTLRKYREDFYFVDQFHGSVLHISQCTTRCEAHTNFVDESACLMADKVQNEGKFLPLFTDNRRC